MAVYIDRMSGRARLAGRVSAIALLAGHAVLGAGVARAQQADPGANANPTAKATTESTAINTAPTPDPQGANTTAQEADVVPADVPAGTDANGDADAPDVVVTGIRASLASSTAIKRNSTLIVDSVSSEDIGRLPDVSIADSLARLPGVTAQRLEGRDQRLSIRGLGPDFTTTLLNGREQVTVNDNRGVEFDQYPSEFFKNVNVYKSADASLIAAGVSGTVDLRMLRPLDQPNSALVVAARGQMNEIDKLNPDGERYGYRASATYVDQFANDTFGIALGVSAQQTPSQNERYNAWGYAGDGSAGGAFLLGGAKPYVQSNLLKRYGGVATIEWRPSDNFHSTFDALYSYFEETQRFRGIEFPLGFAGGFDAATNPGGVTIDSGTVEDGFVTEAVFGQVRAVQRNDLNRRKANNYSFGWNNQLQFTDRLRGYVDLSYSRATRTDFLLETYSGTGYNLSGAPDTVTVTQQGNGTYSIVPTLDYTDTNIFRLTDPRGWGFNGTNAVVQSGFLNRPSITDELRSLRAALVQEFDGGLLKEIEVGGNYSRRKKESEYTSFFLCPVGGGTNCTVASGTPTSAPVPAEALLNKNVSLDYLGVPAVLTLDPLYLFNNSLNAVFDNRPGSLVRDNEVTENIYTGYARLALDGDVGGKPFKGALGLQVVHSRQGSTGTISNFQVVNGAGVVTILPASGRETYTDYLPSFTAQVELVPSFYVKMGASQTMVRARLDQERVNQEFSITPANVNNPQALNSPFSSNGGNVALRPYQSLNVDLSLEKYFRNGGYMSVSGYFKNLTDFIDPSRSAPFDFTAALGQLDPNTRAIVDAQGGVIGLSSAPDNSGRGELLGAEAALSLPLGIVAEGLDGFGFFGSASYNYSSIRYASNPGANITLPGLSDFVGNASAYYEKFGFQARVNYRYRTSFLAEVAGLSANPTFRTADAEGILDAQIGYEFQDGPLRGLSILAQAKNLTDEPFITYQNGDKRQVIDYQRYGRDYYLGVLYKF